MPSVREVNEKEFNKKDISRFDSNGNRIRFSPKDNGYKKNVAARQNPSRLQVPPKDFEGVVGCHQDVDDVNYGRELIAASVREGQDNVKIRYQRFLKEVPSEVEYLQQFGIKKFNGFSISKWNCNDGREVVDEFADVEYGEGVWDND